MKRFFALAALLLALSLLAGCSDRLSLDKIGAFLTGKSQEEQPEEAETPPAEETPPEEMASETVLTEVEAPDVLRLAYQPDYGLNPYTCESLTNRVIFSLLYEPLFLVDSQYQAVPVLAESAQVSEDGLSTTITLRSGVTFHSGAPLTAQDVVYSYTLARDSSYYDGRFSHFSSVTAPDNRTVVITTDTKYEAVTLLLDFPIVRDTSADQAAAPENGETGGESAPSDTTQADANQADTAQTDPKAPLDGTGPFRYLESGALERFDQWWGGEDWRLGYNQVELVVCTTATDIRDHFEYSAVNLVCTDPNAAAYATFHNETDYELWSSPTTVMQYIGFNLRSDVFSHTAIRAAITYAIDRDEIISQDLGGFAVAASLPAAPASAYYDAGLAAKFDLDLSAFAAMLDEAQVQDYTDDGILDVYHEGYAIPVGGTMIVNAGNPQRVETANRIADTLNGLGFQITVEALDSDDYREALRYGNFDLYYGEVRLSPNFDLGLFFRDGGGGSYGGLANSTMLTLCAAMLENSGNAYDLHKRVMEQGYLCPVLFKSYAIYTTRGAASNLAPAVDWPLGQLTAAEP